MSDHSREMLEMSRQAEAMSELEILRNENFELKQRIEALEARIAQPYKVYFVGNGENND